LWPGEFFVAENFEIEKIKIKIRVRKLFRTSSHELAKIILLIPPEELGKYAPIFWQVSNTLPVELRKFSGILVSLFPSFFVGS
jgi:hypothetical protein